MPAESPMPEARHMALVTAEPFRACAAWLRRASERQSDQCVAERLLVASDLMDRLADEVFGS